MTHDPLSEAIASLLSRIPSTWQRYDPASLTDSGRQALSLLTAAGMAERRITFSVRLAGRDDAVRATIEATGESGLAMALESLVTDLFARWGEDWRKLREQTGDRPSFVVQRDEEEWRLTDQGDLACRDLARGDSAPIDFVLRRGFYDDQPRMLPDGRVQSGRPPVKGNGRLIQHKFLSNTPAEVNISNWREGAEAFAEAFEQLSHMLKRQKPVTEQLSGDELLSSRQLAERFGRDPQALKQRLRRWREKHAGSTDWVENTERGPRDPQFLYRLSAVRHIVDEAPPA